MILFRLILILFAFFASCSSHYLTVQMDFLRREQLASFHVDTPDPLLDAPLIGQRLFVHWNIPPSLLEYEDLHLDIVIRFLNHTEMKMTVPINICSGTYIYLLEGKDFCERLGFLTYKADLVGNGCILDMWRHQLWTELIVLNVQ